VNEEARKLKTDLVLKLIDLIPERQADEKMLDRVERLIAELGEEGTVWTGSDPRVRFPATDDRDRIRLTRAEAWMNRYRNALDVIKDTYLHAQMVKAEDLFKIAQRATEPEEEE
jgi:hypothetical protein